MKRVIFFLMFMILICPESFAFSKFADEAFYRYHEFRRSDNQGWLADGETIGAQVTDYVVKCYERSSCTSFLICSTETTSSMISDVSVINGNATRSKVKYKVKAGTTGTLYVIAITIKTSAGQTLIDLVDLSVN